MMKQKKVLIETDDSKLISLEGAYYNKELFLLVTIVKVFKYTVRIIRKILRLDK